MPSPSISEGSRENGELKYPNSNSVSIAKCSVSNSASARRAALRPICPGYLEVFLEPIWTPLPPPVSMQALSTADDIYAYSLPLGDCDLPYALSKRHMSQVNCVKHSVKQLQYVPHDLSVDPEEDVNQHDVAMPIESGAVVAADSGSDKPLTHVWELCYLRGTWVPYPQDTCRLLEDALKSRKYGHDRLVQIKARDVGLHTPVNRHATSSRAVAVDVSAMCQVNVFTGMLHQVRRRRITADIPIGLPACPPPLSVPYTLHPVLVSRIPASIFTKPHAALRVGFDPKLSPATASCLVPSGQHSAPETLGSSKNIGSRQKSRRKTLKQQQLATSDSSGSSQAERRKTRGQDVVVLARSSSSSSSSGAAAATSASASSSSDAVRDSGAYSAAAGSMSAAPICKRAKK